MEITYDGPICQPLTRGGVPRIDHKYDLEITPINKMIQLLCSDLFSPEVLGSLNAGKSDHESSCHITFNLDGDNKFVIILSGITFASIPKGHPLQEYCRLNCDVSIYDISNYKDISSSDIIPRLTLGELGKPILSYNHNFHIKRDDFINNNKIHFWEDQRDWITNGKYTGKTSRFVERMNIWSEDYISSMKQKEDNYEEKIKHSQPGVLLLSHHNNGKKKYNSHEVTVFDESIYDIPEKFKEADIWNWNVGDIHGYGATKEEAYRDFVEKFEVYFDEFEKFAKTVLETDILEGCIKEVDCFGKEIKQ